MKEIVLKSSRRVEQVFKLVLLYRREGNYGWISANGRIGIRPLTHENLVGVDWAARPDHVRLITFVLYESSRVEVGR